MTPVFKIGDFQLPQHAYINCWRETNLEPGIECYCTLVAAPNPPGPPPPKSTQDPFNHTSLHNAAAPWPVFRHALAAWDDQNDGIHTFDLAV